MVPTLYLHSNEYDLYNRNGLKNLGSEWYPDAYIQYVVYNLSNEDGFYIIVFTDYISKYGLQNNPPTCMGDWELD